MFHVQGRLPDRYSFLVRMHFGHINLCVIGVFNVHTDRSMLVGLQDLVHGKQCNGGILGSKTYIQVKVKPYCTLKENY